MTLHKKTLIVVGAVLAAMLVAMYAVSQLIIEEGFLALEERDSRRNLERAQNGLDNVLLALHTTTIDWAHWDDSYDFIQNGNEAYITSNLNDETLQTNALDVVVFVTPAGQIAYAKGYDKERQAAVPVSSDLQPSLTRLNLSEEMDQINPEGIHGLILLPKAPLMVAIVPILRSDRTGPPQGFLLFGRYLDDQRIADIAATSRLSITIYRLDSQNLPSHVQAMQRSKHTEAITPLSEQTITGDGLIRDLENQPILILEVTLPRDIYQQSRISLTYFLVAMVVVGFVFILVMLFVLEKMVLARLARLSATVTRIQLTGDLTTPVETSGHDELTNLALGLKGMLETVVQSQTKLQETNDALERRVIERTAELDYARERIETIFNSSSDIIILASTRGHIQQVNPTFDRVFACAPDEYTNSPLVDLVCPDDAPALMDAMQQAFRGNPVSLELQFVRKNQPLLDAELHLAPVVNDQGIPTHLVCSLHDLTHRKQIEQTLQRAIDHERELNGLKSRFVSMVSHEFRNPLAVIQMAAHSLARYHAKLDEAQREAQFKKIDDQIQHMLDLLNEVLAIGRIQSGRMEYKPEVVNLHQFCQTLVSNVGAANNAENRIQYTGPDDALNASLDPRLMQLVVTNLLTNALKYTPDGGPIEFMVSVVDHLVRLNIRDNGIGIPAHELPHLYEPFHRAENVGRIGGTGLGLYITKQAVELHGGIILCESQVGEGTTFTVEFPARRPEETGQAA